MFVLGVTGGIGSGKTTVARMLEARGARVIDADRIVAGLYASGELPGRIEARFGPGVRARDGSVDRRALGRVVFADPAARAALERMVHPAVREVVESRIAAWRDEEYEGLVVVDAALLVESEHAYPLDALLVVTAPRPLRLARLEKRGLPRDEAQRRMAAQAEEIEKRRKADLLIENGGSLADLEREVERVLQELGRDGPPRSG